MEFVTFIHSYIKENIIFDVRHMVEVSKPFNLQSL